MSFRFFCSDKTEKAKVKPAEVNSYSAQKNSLLSFFTFLLLLLRLRGSKSEGRYNKKKIEKNFKKKDHWAIEDNVNFSIESEKKASERNSPFFLSFSLFSFLF
eukprot:TRINITY_DN195_c0_g1_i9.p1 TRINITY_DN195_c0_g1~~TRINITY_DN195_c0_g1_i9.p1  ORF type:complete len:103 (-),score=3.04 TRINITY_DN195_c0_g1_i9:61-369(-)